MFEATELFKALQSNPALLELLRTHTQPNPVACQAVSNLIHQGTSDSLESKETSNSDASLEARFQRLSVQGVSEAASTQSEPGTAPIQTPRENEQMHAHGQDTQTTLADTQAWPMPAKAPSADLEGTDCSQQPMPAKAAVSADQEGKECSQQQPIPATAAVSADQKGKECSQQPMPAKAAVSTDHEMTECSPPMPIKAEPVSADREMTECSLPMPVKADKKPAEAAVSANQEMTECSPPMPAKAPVPAADHEMTECSQPMPAKVAVSADQEMTECSPPMPAKAAVPAHQEMKECSRPMPAKAAVSADHEMTECSRPMPAISPVEACLRRPNTCDLSDNMTPTGPATRVLVDVGGSFQVATLPMTRQQAMDAGMQVVDDLTPVPVAKTTFQPHADTAEETATARGGNTSGEETDREKTDDEATAEAKKKPSSVMTLEAYVTLQLHAVTHMYVLSIYIYIYIYICMYT